MATIAEIDTDEIDTNEIDTNEIDTDEWIEKLKQAEKGYNDFYKEPVTSITLFFLYINNKKELEHVHTDICLLDNGWLKRENIISYIKNYEILYTIKYKLLSLLHYNIDLNPNEIEDFMREDNNGRFMKSEKYLNDLHYADSIHMFQDLNALYFIFIEDKISTNQTKRVIILSSPNNKTKRNRYKKNLKIIRE